MIEILFLSTSLLAFAGEALPQDSSLQNRNIWQQKFAFEYVQKNALKGEVSSETDLRLLLDGLTEAWGAKVQGESATYTRLNSYVSMWTVRNVMGRPEPTWARCLAWQHYAAPAFLADIDDLNKAEPKAQTSLIIRQSNLRWASLPVAFCEVPVEEWEPISAALRDYPKLVGRYLEASAYMNEEHRGVLINIQEGAARLVPVLDVADALYAQDSNSAFAALAAAFGLGKYRELLAPLGGRLAFQYRDADQLDRAFAVLDLVTQSTTEQTLSRDTLSVWYKKVDAVRGPARIQAILGIEGTASLVPSGDTVKLTGIFATLNGDTMDLELLEGRLVLLDFWSVGCGPCLEEVPTLNTLHERYEDRLVVLGINSDLGYGMNVETVRSVAKQYDMQNPQVLDTGERILMNQFGVEGWPMHILINERGDMLMEPVEKRHGLSLDEVFEFLESQR